MKKITTTVYLTASPVTWEDGGYHYAIRSYENESDIVVSSQEIEMEVPEGFDPTQPHIDLLKAEKQRLAAEAQIKMNNLDEQIQSLLAIECDS